MPETTTAARAVFLSYAREDAEPVRRIADALRAFGVEVWFDQNELRGGDAWDQKIRTQIRTCTLCVPVISATTQARGEGYFRREWRFAVERTHDMAAGVPFLLPVVIDDTLESDALVPDEFMKVQWTRLAKGVPTPQFVEQVRKLLSKEQGAGSKEQGRHRAGPGSAPPATRKGIPGWTWGALGVVVLGIAVALSVSRKPEPLPVVAPVVPAPASVLPAPSHLPAADAKSIAVLPFANLSADKDNEFFADGMHDDLITALAKVRDLKVISRTSVMPYKTGERNLRKIAADLGVANVLEGSVQRAGNRVRLNVQLIDARTDGHLWAETYNKDLTDVFAMQAALTQEIAAALKANLTAGERTLIARRPTENQAAYDLYLRARVLDQGIGVGASRQAYEAAISLYDQAAAADPLFALPHVQASILHGTMYWFGGLDPTPERRARVEAELAVAQRLAPGAPETYLARGSFEYTCRNDWAQALVEYRKAEASLPNDAQLQYRMGIAHRRLGQMIEAQRRFAAAIALNPNELNGVLTYFENLLALRRYRQVIEEISRYEVMFPADRRLRQTHVQARYELNGDRSAYLRDMADLPLFAVDPQGLSAAFENALRAGDLAAAERVLEDPRMLDSTGAGGAINYPVSLTRASVAWLRGRPDDARRFAEEALVYFRSRKWAPRQEPGALLGIARAEALAGRHDEALRDARTALADQAGRDVYSASQMQNYFGQILVICNRPEEALAALRTHLAGYGGATPNTIRHDEYWLRLKDDPRFEEILRSAKTL